MAVFFGTGRRSRAVPVTADANLIVGDRQFYDRWAGKVVDGPPEAHADEDAASYPSAILSPEGSLYADGSHLRVRDAHTWRTLRTAEQLRYSNVLAVRPDGRYFYGVDGVPGRLTFYAVDTGSAVEKVPLAPSAVAVSPDGSRLAVADGRRIAVYGRPAATGRRPG